MEDTVKKTKKNVYGMGTCKTCDKEFPRKGPRSTYCSDECRPRRSEAPTSNGHRLVPQHAMGAEVKVGILQRIIDEGASFGTFLNEAENAIAGMAKIHADMVGERNSYKRQVEELQAKLMSFRAAIEQVEKTENLEKMGAV